jgi:hypothetical protein
MIMVRKFLEYAVTVGTIDCERVALSDALAGDIDVVIDAVIDELVDCEPDMVSKKDIVRVSVEHSDGILAVVVAVMREETVSDALGIALRVNAGDDVINDEGELVDDIEEKALFVGVKRVDAVVRADFVEHADRETFEVT